ncbi:hypothetical protein GE061_002184 [Apolygus lucorum]|uniref:H15 domain-containing protein n=1 Tax=Apolygus lucorum TaxID=248454 RepID=A0A8S9X5V2_APOLU|nr:hypothetical protein GE061_002184 [Apolygus lucorum]
MKTPASATPSDSTIAVSRYPLRPRMRKNKKTASAVPEEAKKSLARPKVPKLTKATPKLKMATSALMITEAIRTLNKRGGSSLQAIKNYLSSIFNTDVKKQAPSICRCIRKAVDTGTLVRTKGKGAAGSFKLPPGSALKNAAKPKAGTKKRSTTSKTLKGKRSRTRLSGRSKLGKRTKTKKQAAKKNTHKNRRVAA